MCLTPASASQPRTYWVSLTPLTYPSPHTNPPRRLNVVPGFMLFMFVWVTENYFFVCQILFLLFILMIRLRFEVQKKLVLMKFQMDI